MGRIAYCVIPESGGLFRFYRNLRQAIAGSAWEVLAVSAGAGAATRWDAHFADDGCHLVAAEETDKGRQARALAEWVSEESIDIVIPMDDSVAASMVPHLPPDVRLVTRCSSATRFAYRICAISPERLSRAVAMTPGQRRGLNRYGGLPAERVALIPHGVDLRSFPDGRREKAAERQALRIVFAGRLEDRTKGVLWLPEIARGLAASETDFQLDIIGSGPRHADLVDAFRRSGDDGRVTMRGRCRPETIGKVLGQSDVLVMPSRIEGFPNVLLEAMAAGVVPVASRIPGVTDFIIDDGTNGLLCPLGRPNAFSAAIGGLARSPERLAVLSDAARQTVEERFPLDRMGRDYDRLFREVLSEPVPDVQPRPWSQFRIDPAYRPGWRRWVPRGVKNTVRRYVQC